jgi:DNA replication protein DnaC
MEEMFEEERKGLILMGPVGVKKSGSLALLLKYYLKQQEAKIQLQIAGYKKQRSGCEEVDDYIIKQWIGWAFSDFVFLTHADLVQHLRRHYGSEGDYGSRYNQTLPNHLMRRYLFLDDFGRGFYDKSGWNLFLESEFWDYRYVNNLPVYLTTNYSQDQLKAMRQDHSQIEMTRIVDRLCDPAWMRFLSMADEPKMR